MPDRRSVDDARIGDVAVQVEIQHRQDQARFQGPLRRALRLLAVFSGELGFVKLPLIPAIASLVVLWMMISAISGALGWKFQTNSYASAGVTAAGVILGILITYGAGKAVGDLDKKDKPNVFDFILVFGSFAPIIWGAWEQNWTIVIVGEIVVILAHFVWTRIATRDTQIAAVYVVYLVALIFSVTFWSYGTAYLANGIGGGGWQLGDINIPDRNLQKDLEYERTTRARLCQQGEKQYCGPAKPQVPTSIILPGFSGDRLQSLLNDFCTTGKLPAGLPPTIAPIVSQYKGPLDQYCSQLKSYNDSAGNQGLAGVPEGVGEKEWQSVKDYYCQAGGVPKGYESLLSQLSPSVCPGGIVGQPTVNPFARPTMTPIPGPESTKAPAQTPGAAVTPTPTRKPCDKGYYWSEVAGKCSKQ